MLRDTRTSIHFGVNFVFAPQPVLDTKHRLQFQTALAEEGLEFTQVNAAQPGALILGRSSPPLEVRIQHPGPPVGQLLILAPHPSRTLDDFIGEAKEVVAALRKTWPGELQVVQRDCSINHLYDVAADHSMEYLWNQRLHGKGEEFRVFGRQVAGGGLRIVLPPTGAPHELPQVELKIESYLQDPRKLFISTQMNWLPQSETRSLDPEPMLTECERFATNEVLAFIEGAEQ